MFPTRTLQAIGASELFVGSGTTRPGAGLLPDEPTCGVTVAPVAVPGRMRAPPAAHRQELELVVAAATVAVAAAAEKDPAAVAVAVAAAAAPAAAVAAAVVVVVAAAVSESSTVVASVVGGTPALAAAAAAAAAAAVVVDLVVAPADTVALATAGAQNRAGRPLWVKLQLGKRLRPFQAACEPPVFRQRELYQRLGNSAGQREDLSLQLAVWPQERHSQDSLPRIRQASTPQAVRTARRDSPLQRCC